MKIFVYGTLLSQNSDMMTRQFNARSPVPAKLKGYALYQVDPYFPGIVPQLGGMALGELWDVPEDAIPKMDLYEGVPSLFRREAAEAEAEDGRKVKADVYIWNGEPQGREIPLGEQPWRSSWDWEKEENGEAV